MADANQAKKVYAIQTSVEPVARESNNDSFFDESLSKLFDVDGNNEADLEMTSYGQRLTDPLTWLLPPPPYSQLETSSVPESELTSPLSQVQPANTKTPASEPPHRVRASVVKAPTSATTEILPTKKHSSSSSRATSSKAENLKPAPVKAAATEVEPAGDVPRATTEILSTKKQVPGRTSRAASSNSTNLKRAPVKAAATKVKPAGVVSRPKRHHQEVSRPDQITPYTYLKTMLAERGYSFGTIKSAEVGYMIEPSPLQLASFGTKLLGAAQTSDVTLLSSLLGCGLSPNPCNHFKDSVLNWVLKKADAPVFQCFLDHNTDLRVCDGFGRTPLHHVAWADTFVPSIASVILQRDPAQLFLKDNSDQTPLEYVPPSLTAQWIAYLESHKEEMFPTNGAPIAVTKRYEGQLPDPPNAISVDLAQLVSKGKVHPEQIALLDELTRKTWKMPT